MTRGTAETFSGKVFRICCLSTDYRTGGKSSPAGNRSTPQTAGNPGSNTPSRKSNEPCPAPSRERWTTTKTTQAKQYFRTWDLSEYIKYRYGFSSRQGINQPPHAIRREEKRSQASPSAGTARRQGATGKKTGSSPPEQGCCPGFPEMVHTGGRTYHSGYRIREVHHIGMKRYRHPDRPAYPQRITCALSGLSHPLLSDSFHPPEYARRHGP